MSTKLSRQDPVDLPYINSCNAGFFKISGQSIRNAVILLPDRVEPIIAGSINDIDESMLKPVLDIDPPVEVVLIGTGSEFALLPVHLGDRIRAAAIGVETMATRSACLTYNLLVGEGRRVAAVLLPLS